MRRVPSHRRMSPGYADQYNAPGVPVGVYARTVKAGPAPGTPLGRSTVLWLVRECDGVRVRRTVSDPATGAYAFAPVDARYYYSVISYDPLPDGMPGRYQAVIADRQRVEPD